MIETAYKKIDEDDIAYFCDIVGEKYVFCGEKISEDYSHDELDGVEKYPEILLKVRTTEQISKIMAYAHLHHIPVVVRGSGTGLVGASVAIAGGIMLETTLMNKILELDEENLTVTVEPGVLIMELTKYVEAHDYFYPPDPGEKSATIGGNISTNAGGMRAVKYGVTRDYVRGLTAVLPSGEVVEVGGKVVKNSSGYSIKDLLIGSEGTLAIITKAVLKLLPLPKYSVSLLIPFSNMDLALKVVPRIIKSKAIPTAIEYFSQDCIIFAENYLGKKFPDSSSDAYLLLLYDGSSIKNIENDYQSVAELCLDNGALDIYIIDTYERKKAVWSARGSFLEAIKASTTEMDECDVVVPRNKIFDFIEYTFELANEFNIRILSFGHAGDGNLHIYVCRDELSEDIWRNKLNKAFDAMYAEAKRLNGLVSGEHGIGYAKKSYLTAQCGETYMHLMRGIKSIFDPHNILNPGKVCQ